MQGKDGGMTPRDAYRERLRHLGDEQLKREWDLIDGEGYDYAAFPRQLADLKHEMALRFLGKSESQKNRQDARAYFWDKLFRKAEEFGGLVAAGEYFKAMYLYNQACMLTVFLELPEEMRPELFGREADDGTYINGLFARKDVNRVIRECVVYNKLGYDCMVYRIPGEVGYHGARSRPGMRPDRAMKREENPAHMQEASGQ